MSNLVYPTLAGIAFGNTKNPTFLTKTQRSVSGVENRVSMRAYPLWEFELSYEFLRTTTTLTELQTLLGFFMSRQGSFDSFLFSDPTDNTVTAQSIGTGTGSLTTFQLARTYGGFTEPVQNVNSTVAAAKIYVNGTLQTLTTNYTLSATGLVTFVTAPANAAAITWTGSYYYRVRFMDDVAQFSQMMNNLWELKKISFVGSTMNKV